MNEMTHTCVFCDSIEVAEVVYENRVAAGRRKLDIAGLKRMECPDCCHEYVEQDQLAFNLALIESATTAMSQARKNGSAKSSLTLCAMN